MTCPLCNQEKPIRARIEAEFIAGTLSATDVASQFDDMDLLEVLVHFSDHGDAMEEEVERKKKFLGQSPAKPDAKLENGYVDEPLPKVKPEEVNSLEMLYRMFAILEDKLFQVSQTKQITGLGTITKELRETLKEIDRVKKDQKASMADRTDELLLEHKEMTRFLLYNQCTVCSEKYQAFLRGEFETHAVDAHGENRSNEATDVELSGTVE